MVVCKLLKLVQVSFSGSLCLEPSSSQVNYMAHSLTFLGTLFKCHYVRAKKQSRWGWHTLLHPGLRGSGSSHLVTLSVEHMPLSSLRKGDRRGLPTLNCLGLKICTPSAHSPLANTSHLALLCCSGSQEV